MSTDHTDDVSAAAAPAAATPGSVAPGRRLWSQEEDKLLVDAVDKYGAQNWSRIAAAVGTRKDWQCCERWRNHLSPDVSKDPWAPSEDELLLSAVARVGHKWSKMTSLFPTRTSAAIKNRYHTLCRRSSSQNNSPACSPALAMRRELLGDPSAASLGPGAPVMGQPCLASAASAAAGAMRGFPGRGDGGSGTMAHAASAFPASLLHGKVGALMGASPLSGSAAPSQHVRSLLDFPGCLAPQDAALVGTSGPGATAPQGSAAAAAACAGASPAFGSRRMSDTSSLAATAPAGSQGGIFATPMLPELRGLQGQYAVQMAQLALGHQTQSHDQGHCPQQPAINSSHETQLQQQLHAHMQHGADGRAPFDAMDDDGLAALLADAVKHQRRHGGGSVGLGGRAGEDDRDLEGWPGLARLGSHHSSHYDGAGGSSLYAGGPESCANGGCHGGCAPWPCTCSSARGADDEPHFDDLVNNPALLGHLTEMAAQPGHDMPPSSLAGLLPQGFGGAGAAPGAAAGPARSRQLPAEQLPPEPNPFDGVLDGPTRQRLAAFLADRLLHISLEGKDRGLEPAKQHLLNDGARLLNLVLGPDAGTQWGGDAGLPQHVQQQREHEADAAGHAQGGWHAAF